MPIEFQIPSLRIQVRERMPEEESEQLRLQQLLETTKKTPTRRLRRKTQCVEQKPTQKHRIEWNRCQHDRKETPTRRLRRKTQCVERRPAGYAEKARDRNRKCS